MTINLDSHLLTSLSGATIFAIPAGGEVFRIIMSQWNNWCDRGYVDGFGPNVEFMTPTVAWPGIASISAMNIKDLITFKDEAQTMCRQYVYSASKVNNSTLRVAQDVRAFFKANQVVAWRAASGTGAGTDSYNNQEAIVQSVSYSSPNTDIVLTTSPITYGSTFQLLPDPEEHYPSL